MGDTARRRTDDPNEEEERDEARCQNRYDGFNGSAEGAHRQPRHHPINYKARTTVAGGVIVSAGSMQPIEGAYNRLKGTWKARLSRL